MLVVREPSCESLLDRITDARPRITVRIPRLIVNEVRRHLTPEAFKEFLKLLDLLSIP